MASKTVLLLGGFGFIGTGIWHLLSKEFARKFLYARAFGSWRPFESKKIEEIGIALIRFVLGPVLIIVGCLLIAKGFVSAD